ncbi:MAG: RNA methyltransferase [Candidatus Muiribacteriaceae bacterium]
MSSSICLLHNNIVNKHGNIIETSVTNIDIHDISRTARTYGIDEFCVVTRLRSQKRLLDELLDYWIHGKGGEINPDRKEALSLVAHYSEFNELFNRYKDPRLIITDATPHERNTDFSACRRLIEDDSRHNIIIFGTGWGLDPLITEKADIILEPVMALSDYNHLSVRSAVAIIVDRLFAF